MNQTQKRYSVAIITALTVLVGTWMLIGSDATSSRQAISDDQVNLDGQKQFLEPEIVKNDDLDKTKSGDLALSSLAAVQSDGNQQEDTSPEINEGYKNYVLDPETPIADALPGLIRLANQDNGDALFRLLVASDNCRSMEGSEYCPGKGLADLSSDQGSTYFLMRKAASKGSLEAMTFLVHLAPPPFKNKEEMAQNGLMRATFAEIVNEHNESAIHYLESAAQSGYPAALLESANIYAFGDIVDPDREKSAFWALAWSKVTDNPIPGYIQAAVIDQMDPDVYQDIDERATRFTDQF